MARGLEPNVLGLLELEGLRRQPWRREEAALAAAAARGLARARTVPWEKTSPAWRVQAAAVHRVLREV